VIRNVSGGNMKELYIDEPFESIYHEIKAMIKYVYSKGEQVPPGILEKYSEIEKEIYAFNEREGSENIGQDLNKYENIASLSVKMGDVHNVLAQMLEPAIPKSIYIIESQLDTDSIWTQFGCLPLIRRLMVVSISSMVIFITVSLSSRINSEIIRKSLFTLEGLNLFLFFLFLLSASAIGASFSSLLRATKYIVNRTFDTKYETSYWVQLLVGLMSGLIITELVPQDIFGKLSNVGKPTLALLGGFSSDLVYKVLQHFVNIVESAIVPGKKHSEAPQRNSGAFLFNYGMDRSVLPNGMAFSADTSSIADKNSNRSGSEEAGNGKNTTPVKKSAATSDMTSPGKQPEKDAGTAHK